jgi:hypothetical protein
MISAQSRTKDWIMGIRGTSRIPTDPILIEKMILALTLLENLRTSGLDFIFKGGTSLLLVLGAPMRFSIDLDIVMETDQGLEEALQSVLQQGIFHRVEEDERTSQIPKQHYKFFFNSAIESIESSILLDILFEENPYPACQMVGIQSDLVVTEGEITQIKCPAPECLLGDKLTAFAPHTTGILYGKYKDLEIIKQLYDLGLLFDIVTDMSLVAATFHTIAARELAYRGLNEFSPADVLVDSFHTACLIGMRGYSSEKEYTELLSGIRKLAGFVYAEHFTLDSAILCAAKVAYIAALIGKGDQNISRFDLMIDLSSLAIQNPAYNRLNKVKKTSPEAFYYFYHAIEGIVNLWSGMFDQQNS